MRQLLSLILAALLVTSCAHRADPVTAQSSADRVMSAMHFAGFVVRGNLLEPDGIPADYVEVYFIDLGLDYVRSKQAWEFRIGTSDENGTLDQRFDYGWCTETSFKALGVEVPDFTGETEEDPHILFSEALWEAWSNAKLPQPFAIEIRAEGFEPHRVEFDLTPMPQLDGPHILELGTVKVEATS
ncbi:MAG: hypothetical protein JNK74_10705 [Candidatus Hydrogenedentes bacterium]|nr:hypothetical protein [Candidatus Hydrogenedentota bacterium]